MKKKTLLTCIYFCFLTYLFGCLVSVILRRNTPFYVVIFYALLKHTSILTIMQFLSDLFLSRNHKTLLNKTLVSKIA
jgi:hypothetical protein